MEDYDAALLTVNTSDMPAFTTQDQMTSLSPRVYSHDLKS